MFLGVEPSELAVGDNGVYGIFDGGRFLLLAELHAVRAGHDPVPSPSLGRWQVRLLHDAGLVELPPLTLRPVEGADYVERVRAGLELRSRGRWFLGDSDPPEFSWRFGAAWASVTGQEVGDGLRRLAAAGSIVQVGERRYAGRPSPIWLPVEAT